MKTIIIYISIHHGNTEKIAKAIANVLRAKLVKPNEVKPNEILNYDLIGFGSGIYFSRYHRSLIDFVKKMPLVQNKKAFIFSTSGRKESAIFNQFAKNFKKILIAKGFKIVGEFNCLGFDTFGLLKLTGGINKNRPSEQDLKRAEEFAKNLKILEL